MAKSNDTSNTEVKAIPDALSGLNVAANKGRDTAIALITESMDLANVGASWANDRIAPMIQAIAELGAYTSEKPQLVAQRLALIRRMAKETIILVEDMAVCFEAEERDFKAKLAVLEGGVE